MATKKLTLKDIMSFSPENEKVFEELSNLCINKKIVPYIGAGLSVFAGFKTWNKFINDEYEKCFPTQKPDNMDNIIAADKIEEKQGKDDFYENVRITFGGNLNDAEWKYILNKAINQAISVIPTLFYGPIVTTNFDQIIEKIHNNNLPVVFPYNSEELEKAIHNRKRIVYKIHGCVSESQKIVFTKNVYDKVYDDNSELVKSVSKFFQGFQFLFLGCSLGVTNTKGDTKDYSMELWEKLQNSGTYHFAILDCTKEQLSVRRKELEERNIYPILFESGKLESIKIILDELLSRNNKRLFQIPQYNSQYNSPYIERESNIIQKIKSKLNDTEFSACAIIGSGGVGKTRIMSEYAHEVKKTGAEVFWFSAISADYIKEEIRQFSLEKGLIIEANKDGNYILQVFKNWMVENEDWLFLLDNVEHYQDIKIFLDIDNTLIGKRHILLTSRNEESEIYNIQTVELEVFNKNESLKFLKLHTNQTHNEYTEKIAEYLDGLPLALEQAAAYIREDKTSYKGYYELLEKDTISSLEKKRLSHTESVGATWNISMQRITEAAQQMLYLCSYMAPENIDEILFSENSELLPLPLIEKFSEHLERNNIWSQLTRYSLLKKQDDGEGYSIHRLLQGVVRHKINSEPQWAQCCLSLFYKSYDFKYGDIESQNYFSKLTLHMEHFLNVAKKILTTDEEQKMIVHLYHEGGFGSHHLGNYSSALEYYGCALSICEKILGKEHLNTATTYNNMAEVFRAQGNYVEALKYFNYALAIREREKHPDTASTYNNIAEVFRTLGEYDKALKYYDDALIIYEKNLHPDTAIVYNNMALVFESQGDYDKALKYYSDALIIYEKNLGKEHPNIANTYNNMALVFYTQSNYVKALEYYGYALDIFEKILGKKHPNISSTYNNIAVVFKKQGDYDKALEYYGYALEIREKVFGKEHPNTATTYNNMAGVFYAQGDYDKALEYYGYDLKTCKKILGEEHPDTATAYNNMAMVFKDKGDYNKALEYCSCALTIREKILGKHPSTATTYNNMALIFRAQGDYSKALEYYSYDLEICEEVLGKEHPNTATTYNNMAGVFKDQGNYDKALEWYIKAYRICLNKFGLEHPNTNIALENMVHAYSLSSKTMNFEKWLKEQMK